MSATTSPTTSLLADLPGDRSLAGRVKSFLAAAQPAALGRIRVSAQGGKVIVEGELPSFYERQLAIACIKRVAGVREIDDKLLVCKNLSSAPAAESAALKRETSIAQGAEQKGGHSS